MTENHKRQFAVNNPGKTFPWHRVVSLQETTTLIDVFAGRCGIALSRDLDRTLYSMYCHESRRVHPIDVCDGKFVLSKVLPERLRRHVAHVVVFYVQPQEGACGEFAVADLDSHLDAVHLGSEEMCFVAFPDPVAAIMFNGDGNAVLVVP
jgi:hypothetical protein